MHYEVLGEIFQEQFNKVGKERCKKVDNYCKRERFLSRLFGIFNEEIVDIWCQNKEISPYENLGRPSLYSEDEKYLGTTLDFTFRDRITNKIYIVEMKCEIQYQNFKYFHLNDEDELEGFLEHHNKKAFERFEALGENHNECIVKYTNLKTKKKQNVDVSGIILIWGKVNQENIEDKEIGDFHKILSVERMISDLVKCDDEYFKSRIAEYHSWSNDMFDQLVGKPSKENEFKENK